MKIFRTTGMASLLAVGLLALTTGTASAQSYPGSYGYAPGYQSGPGFGGYGGGYQSGPSFGGFQSGPVYDPPSVHYDRVYHPTTTHWTPFRGLHTHGHVDTVPHYTPGHLDYQNGPYVQPNPYFHRH